MPKANTAHLSLGENASVDESVILAYPASRSISDRRLVIGAHARILSGSVIYEGTTIGSHFATGHNVVIREENLLLRVLCVSAVKSFSPRRPAPTEPLFKNAGDLLKSGPCRRKTSTSFS